MQNNKHRTLPSTVVQSFRYDAVNNILKIVYTSGAVYQYLDVPLHVYTGFTKAKSKGTFLNKQIKGIFDFELLSAAPEE